MITFIREVHRVYLDTCLLLIAVNYSAADAMETNIDFYFQVLFHTRITAAYGGLPWCMRNCACYGGHIQGGSFYFEATSQ